MAMTLENRSMGRQGVSERILNMQNTGGFRWQTII